MLEVVFTKEKPQNQSVRLIPMVQSKQYGAKVDCLSADEAKFVKKAIVQSGFDAKDKEILDVFGGKSKIVLAGLGKVESALDLQNTGKYLFGRLKNDEDVYIASEDDETALNLAFGILLGSYSFDKYKTEKKAEDYPKLEKVTVRAVDVDAVREAFKSCLAVVTGVRYCKDLCNEPANYLTPEVFAADIKRLEYLGLDVEVLDGDAIKSAGMGLVEAVAKGGSDKPAVVVVSWRGNRKQEEYDLGLAGKGVCFDSGGLSLKSTAGMLEMKMDMFGAAAVVATMKAAALQRVRKNLIAIVGLVENMPSGNAMKIGDIYNSVSGKTVEIVNTDAEGRLILADCLAYLQRHYKVKKIIDLATLGSLRTVLGNVYAGMFANDEKMAKDLIKSGEASGEKLWKMPLDRAYEAMLASPIADIRNVAVDGKASITSAAFLARFIEKGSKWAHIDISGVRMENGMASGFGVRLLNEFIKGL